MAVLLEHRSWWWPVMLFPHIPRSHTASMIGWRGWRPVWAKGIVAGWAGRIVLTSESLRGRSHLGGLGGHIAIPLQAIETVQPSPRAEGLLEVRFRESRKSRLLGFMTRGELDGVVLLNLGDACGEWLAALGPGDDASPG